MKAFKAPKVNKSQLPIASTVQRFAFIDIGEKSRSNTAARCRWKNCHFLARFPALFLSPEEEWLIKLLAVL